LLLLLMLHCMQAYAAEKLMLVYGFPYDKVQDLDEAEGKAALCLAEEDAVSSQPLFTVL
jgi:hypothetical protein